MLAEWSAARAITSEADAGSLASAFHGTAVIVFLSALATLRTPMTFVDGISFVTARSLLGTTSEYSL